MKNGSVRSTAKHFVMQPGDATMYRFSIIDEAEPAAAFIVGSGISPTENYVKVGIDMPSGGGFGNVSLDRLNQDVQSTVQYCAYLQSHGFSAVNPYTLVAVIFAVSILAYDSLNLAGAAQNMLNARKMHDERN